jgi:uncharacterized protein YndB with AHSA1/START domain
LKEFNVPDIRHRVVMSAPLDRVYSAIATKEGLSDWWTRDGVRGRSAEGSTIELYFGKPEPAAIMEVTQLDPVGRVGWTCIAGADEWVGTKLSFVLTLEDDETVVLFTHAEWRDPSDLMAHCSARWAYFLLSLKGLVETGNGTPFPEDLKF